MKFQEIDGDLVALGLQGHFDVVIQGNNCFCVQGAGLAPQFVKAFKSDEFEMEGLRYKGDMNKLGTIDYMTLIIKDGRVQDEATEDFSYLAVVNCYTQYGFGTNHSNGSEHPADYEAITLCMRKINHEFAGQHIGVPLIGCGLAGANWTAVKAIIKQELRDVDVTIVYYKP